MKEEGRDKLLALSRIKGLLIGYIFVTFQSKAGFCYTVTFDGREKRVEIFTESDPKSLSDFVAVVSRIANLLRVPFDVNEMEVDSLPLGDHRVVFCPTTPFAYSLANAVVVGIDGLYNLDEVICYH